MAHAWKIGDKAWLRDGHDEEGGTVWIHGTVRAFGRPGGKGQSAEVKLQILSRGSDKFGAPFWTYESNLHTEPVPKLRGEGRNVILEGFNGFGWAR